MENLELKATAKTPEIRFNAESGSMLIKGRAIPLDAEEFWGPVLKWFYAYATDPKESTQFIFDMEYFNISSSKQILFILHKLNDLVEADYAVTIEWRYQKDDLEMKEAGSDFSCVIDVPIQLVETEEALAAVV